MCKARSIGKELGTTPSHKKILRLSA
jgi:hypothetical protein